jgi:hypothetical protein
LGVEGRDLWEEKMGVRKGRGREKEVRRNTGKEEHTTTQTKRYALRAGLQRIVSTEPTLADALTTALASSSAPSAST